MKQFFLSCFFTLDQFHVYVQQCQILLMIGVGRAGFISDFYRVYNGDLPRVLSPGSSGSDGIMWSSQHLNKAV